MTDDQAKRREAIREFWREKLAGGTLDKLFEEAKTHDHEGSCWDLVNMLADIITPITDAYLATERERAEVEARLDEVRYASERVGITDTYYQEEIDDWYKKRIAELKQRKEDLNREKF